MAGGAAPAAKLITAEEGAVMVDELEATAPFIDQRYPDDVALAVRAALTDAELFVSYNMPAKALGPLSSALPKAPRDLRMNQRLVSLHTRAGRFAEAAVCCRTLEQLYHDAGHPDEATRYAELATKYEERASSKPAEAKPAAVKPISRYRRSEKTVSAVGAEVKAPVPVATPVSIPQLPGSPGKSPALRHPWKPRNSKFKLRPHQRSVKSTSLKNGRASCLTEGAPPAAEETEAAGEEAAHAKRREHQRDGRRDSLLPVAVHGRTGPHGLRQAGKT